MRGKTRYGDKTPFYVMHTDRLAGLFPEAVFIHIIRDGRDVALSLVERALPRDMGQAAIFWRDRVRTGRRVGATLGSGYLEIRYEDLLRDPRTTLAAVCAHAELRFDEAIMAQMLRYHEQAPLLLQDAADPSVHENVTTPLTSGLRNWREQMPARDRVLIEAIARDTLRATGYPLAPFRTTNGLNVWTRAASARLRWSVRSRLLLSLFWCKSSITTVNMNAVRWAPAAARLQASSNRSRSPARDSPQRLGYPGSRAK